MLQKLLIATLLAFSSSTTCPTFQCKGTNQQFQDKQCILWDQSLDSYWLFPCTGYTNTTYCPTVSGGSKSNSFCQTPPTPQQIQKYPGEKCITSTDCDPTYSKNGCSSNICQGSSQGDSCNSNFQCNPGLYCGSDSKCTPQKKISQTGCTNDYMCVNGGVCQKPSNKQGTCVVAFSLSTGNTVQGCSSQNSTYACESTLCGLKEEEYVCLEFVRTMDNLPSECVTSDDCKSTQDELTDLVMYSECLCGFDSVGDKICGLHPGDDMYRQFLKILKEWSGTVAIERCNTERRFDLNCVQDWWDYDNFIAYKYFQGAVVEWSFVQGNDECVQDIYESEFYRTKELYEETIKPEDDSGASEVLAGLAAILIVQ